MHVKSIVFDDEITLYWEKEDGNKTYVVRRDGEIVGQTEKTHFSLKHLKPNGEYAISVDDTELSIRTKKKKKRIDVTAFGAVGDGKTSNTRALQKILDDCAKDECVYFPAGTYLTGALDLHGDTELYLEEGSILQGVCEAEAYLPKIKSRFEGIECECYRSLLNAGKLDSKGGFSCENVVIRGGGTVSGGGKELCRNMIETERERLTEYLKANEAYVKTCENSDTIPGRARGRLVNISNCKNVVFSNITFQNGPAWNLHFVYSENITVFGCKIVSHGVFNGDGIDPDSSKNCVVFDTEFDTSDDCIAIKSGKNPEGNRIDRPCENIDVFDCRAVAGHGFSIGSEMSGGVKNVRVWDCDMRRCRYGLQIKGTPKRGGYVKNVSVRDCLVPCILVWSVGYNDDGESAPHPPEFSDYRFENLTIFGRDYDGETRYVCLYGFEEKGYEIDGVYLKNITLSGVSKDCALQAKHVKNIVWEE